MANFGINSLLNRVEEISRNHEMAEAARRSYETSVKKFREETPVIREELVGKVVNFEMVTGHSFWPRQYGQDWWGTSWKHHTYNDHEWFEESHVVGPGNVCGIVVAYYHNDQLGGVIPHLVVVGEHFYFEVRLTYKNLSKLTVLKKADY